jgi:type VI secretion system secreted protein Hcp
MDRVGHAPAAARHFWGSFRSRKATRMALNAYLRLSGETQGDILGSVTQKGREDSIMIIGVTHEVSSPRDAASGLPTGKRQHKPMTVVKEIDKATPLIYYSLVNNENIPQWECQFWRPSATGQEQQFYTVKLMNASVSNIRFEMLNNKYPENMQHREREHVSFCYQKIEWVWVDGGISAEDDWESPMV